MEKHFQGTGIGGGGGSTIKVAGWAGRVSALAGAPCSFFRWLRKRWVEEAKAEAQAPRKKAKTKKSKKPATPQAQDDHRSPPSPQSPQPQRTPPEEEDLQVLIARHAAAAKAKSQEDEEP